MLDLRVAQPKDELGSKDPIAKLWPMTQPKAIARPIMEVRSVWVETVLENPQEMLISPCDDFLSRSRLCSFRSINDLQKVCVCVKEEHQEAPPDVLGNEPGTSWFPPLKTVPTHAQNPVPGCANGKGCRPRTHWILH